MLLKYASHLSIWHSGLRTLLRLLYSFSKTAKDEKRWLVKRETWSLIIWLYYL